MRDYSLYFELKEKYFLLNCSIYSRERCISFACPAFCFNVARSKISVRDCQTTTVINISDINSYGRGRNNELLKDIYKPEIIRPLPAL